jgi:cell envelope opacity-associated protein A
MARDHRKNRQAQLAKQDREVERIKLGTAGELARLKETLIERGWLRSPEEMRKEHAEMQKARKVLYEASDEFRNRKQVEAAQKQIEAAQKQLEAVAKLSELMPGKASSIDLEPVRAKYPTGVPHGHTEKAMELAGWKKSPSQFRKLLRKHGL